VERDVVDAVKSLLAHRTEDLGCYEFVLEAWMEKAANEIERLREAIRRLAEQDATLSVCDGNVTVQMDAAEWIAVSERLPEDGEQCLAARGDDVGIVWWHSEPPKFIHEDIDNAWIPTHWIPLPEPPEAK